MTETTNSLDEAAQNYAPGVLRTLRAATGELDPYLLDCAACGGQQRAEMRAEWRSMTDVCRETGYSASDVLESGALVTAFGLVKCGVPYVTCMHCGLDSDASKPRRGDNS